LLEQIESASDLNRSVWAALYQNSKIM